MLAEFTTLELGARQELFLAFGVTIGRSKSILRFYSFPLDKYKPIESFELVANFPIEYKVQLCFLWFNLFRHFEGKQRPFGVDLNFEVND